MFFWRGKSKASKARAGRTGATPGKTAAGARKAGAGRQPAQGAATRAGAGKQPVKGAAGAPAPQTRKEAERLILQRLADGSARKQQRMSTLQSASQVFDEYPDEAARLVRSWLSDRKG